MVATCKNCQQPIKQVQGSGWYHITSQGCNKPEPLRKTR